MKVTIFLLLLFHVSTQLYSQTNTLITQSVYNSNFIIDGIQRNFYYYTPLAYGDTTSSPLIIFLHEKDQEAKDVLNKYGDIIHRQADSLHAMIIYPDAVYKHWNAFDPFLSTDTINDIGFLYILIDYFIQQYQCNQQQVYVAGFGNGAAMAIKLAMQQHSKVSAIAPFFYNNNKKVNDTVKIMDTAGIEKDNTKMPYYTAIRKAFAFFHEQLSQ